MRIALDIDDTIARCPQFFSVVSTALKAAGHQVYIISYREDRGFAEEDLAEHAVVFDELILPAPEELYRSASSDWKAEAAAWKAATCRRLQIDVLFDDMPEVVNAVEPPTVVFMATDAALGKVAYHGELSRTGPSQPERIKEACTYLKQHDEEPWDAHETWPDAQNFATPLGRLVLAILKTGQARVLDWLVLFAARRALPCWTLYCDGELPLRAVEAARKWVTMGLKPRYIEVLAAEAQPAYRGRPIRDCRSCDTGCAASAAALAIRYLDSRRPVLAVCCLSSADDAFSQSPLCYKGHFREWLLAYAIPIACENREMSQAEQQALLEFDPQTMPLEREKQASFWNKRS